MHRARLYANSNTVQKKDAVKILERFCDLMNWPENCDVLDIGCGSGDVTSEVLFPILKSCRKLVGVDISPAMVEYAALNHKDPRLSFYCLNIENCYDSSPRQFFPSGFHKIFSFYCLHWIMEQRTAIKNMYELLEPNGDLLLVFLAKNPIFTVYEKLSNTIKWSPYMKDVSRYISPYHNSDMPSAELKRHLEAVGFHIEVCECRDEICTFTNLDLLKFAVKAVNPFLDRIPSELQEFFLNECVNEVANLSTKNNDGSISTSYKLFVAFAKK